MVYPSSFSKDIIIYIAIVAIIGLSATGWYALISFRSDHVDNTVADYRVNFSGSDTKINDTQLSYHLKTKVILNAF